MALTSLVYSLIVSNVTDGCYGACLPAFPPAAKILDVGIGNGEMLKTYHETIRAKRLSIVGLDVDKEYLARCNALIRDFGLDTNIRTHRIPVEEYVPPAPGFFDCVLFSMSFMLLKDPRLVLRRIRPWLAPRGQMVFVQTMFARPSRFLELVKPRLKYLTTVDFGRVIYEQDFFLLLRSEGLEVVDDRLIARKWFGGEHRMIATRA